MKNPHDIILRPVLTEASYDGIAKKDYTFEVAVKANKTEIKQAIETIFDVKVERVNTLRQTGKVKRMGLHSGRRAEVKKAYVKLTENSKPIAFFEGSSDKPEEVECKQWLEAILYDKEPLVKPEQAFVVTKILDNIYKSAAQGKEIKF